MYWWRIGLLVGLFVGAGYVGHARAAGDPFEQTSLAGITTLQVVVEDLNPHLVQGLGREQIKDYVSEQLERAGIGVEPQAEHAFYIHLDAVKNPFGWYSYNISFQLLQMVLLFRDPGVVTWGTTWSLSKTGTLSPESPHEIGIELNRGLKMFLTDYRAANLELWDEPSALEE